MPSSAVHFRISTGVFYPTLLKILEKKLSRSRSRSERYTPFAKWDPCTDLAYRCVVSTICCVVFLLSAKLVISAGESGWIVDSVFDLFGGCLQHAGNLLMDRHLRTVTDIRTDAMCATSWCNELLLMCNDGRCYRYGQFCTDRDTKEYHAKPNVPLLLFLSGDVELNPGPTTEQLINNLGERIESKFDHFSTEFKAMYTTVNNMAEKLEKVTHQLREREKDMQNMKKQIDTLEHAMVNLQNEMERQEIFSRRDNLILHGIPERTEKETHDDCAKTVIEILNKATKNHDRTWDVDDVARAHRLGKPTTRHRPIIVKMQRSRDKRRLITDRQLREDLKKEKVSISDDLTARQRQTLREERERGVIAYYRGARLFTRPPTQRRRSNTQTTADHSDDDSTYEDPLQDPDQQPTPTPQPPAARRTDAAWRQFRQQSRERSTRSAETSRASRREGGGRGPEVSSRSPGDSSHQRRERLTRSAAQDRRRAASGERRRQHRIDHMLGTGPRGNSR